MDPLRQMNAVQLQDPLSKSLDLTKQISDALDLVTKQPGRSGRASGTHSVCSPCSESSCVPLNSSLQNGLAHEPEKTHVTTMGNVQSDGAAGKPTKWRKTEENREWNGTGPQDAPSSRSCSWVTFPTVETLSSECSGHARQAECVSSDDSSLFEVPVSIPGSKGASVTCRDGEKQKPTKERTENSSSSILIELDVLQDSDSLETRNAPFTSEAENTDFYKPTQNGSGPLPSVSSASPSQKRAPETKNNRNQQRKKPSAGKKATASAAKRRKKKKHSGLSSSPSEFPPHGPEIKLKYASCKEEKREGRGNDFAPYVRMEISACTVINFEEDGNVQVNKQRQTSPGVVPSTSCLHLGRLGPESRRQAGDLCCLCGYAANTAGLGDLHGPYHPHGADGKTSTEVLMSGYEDTGVKRVRLSDEAGERWVHEDCSIWSAGVFLVKGRLYGLEEAVRLTQETVSLYSGAFVCRCSFS